MLRETWCPLNVEISINMLTSLPDYCRPMLQVLQCVQRVAGQERGCSEGVCRGIQAVLPQRGGHPGLPHMEHVNLLQSVGCSDRMGEDGWVEHLLVVNYISLGSLVSYLRVNSYDWLAMCRLAQTAAAGLAHLHQVVSTPGRVIPSHYYIVMSALPQI